MTSLKILSIISVTRHSPSGRTANLLELRRSRASALFQLHISDIHTFTDFHSVFRCLSVRCYSQSDYCGAMYFNPASRPPSNGQHPSNDDCLEDKRQLAAVICGGLA